MDIDITQDLVDGSDGSLGDAVPGSHGAAPALQPGTVPVNGTDAVKVQEAPVADKSATSSIREQLSSAFKGTEEPAVPVDGAPAGTAPVLTKDETGKYRNTDGTFASAEQIAAFEAASTAAPEAAPETVFAGMTPVEQEQFKSLPAELQQFVGRTMEGLNARQAQYGEYDFLEQQLIGPRREAWAQNGMNPAAALNQLLALSDFAGRDPGQFVLYFAEQNGVDIDALLDERDLALAQGTAVSPEIARLTAQVEQLTNHITQGQQTQQEAAQAERLTLVQNFAAEKEASGSLKRPYLPEVMQGWAAQIQALRTQNPNMPNEQVLQQAYEHACWANPTVRAKMQEATVAQQRAEEARRVEAAKNAGASVNGGAPAAGIVPSGANGSNTDLSLREQLAQQFAASRN